MKVLVKTLFLLFIIARFSYAMDKDPAEIFEDNFNLLSPSIQYFVNDFKSWSREDKDKMKIYSHNGEFNYVMLGKPIATEKYNGSITYWLEQRLIPEERQSFLWVISNLKK